MSRVIKKTEIRIEKQLDVRNVLRFQSLVQTIIRTLFKTKHIQLIKLQHHMRTIALEEKIDSDDDGSQKDLFFESEDDQKTVKKFLLWRKKIGITDAESEQQYLRQCSPISRKLYSNITPYFASKKSDITPNKPHKQHLSHSTRYLEQASDHQQFDIQVESSPSQIDNEVVEIGD